MTALNFGALRERLQDKDDDSRLVVCPLLDPKRQLSENQAAIDVRLGRVFSIVRPWALGVGELVDVDGPGP